MTRPPACTSYLDGAQCFPLGKGPAGGGPLTEPRTSDPIGGRLGAAGWGWRGLDGGHGSSMLPGDVASTADRCLLGPYPAGPCSGDSEHATYRDVRPPPPPPRMFPHVLACCTAQCRRPPSPQGGREGVALPVPPLSSGRAPCIMAGGRSSLQDKC
jgi:hypothetical protein